MASCEVGRPGRDWKVRSLCQGPNLPCSRTRGEIQPAAHPTTRFIFFFFAVTFHILIVLSYIKYCSILELIRPSEDIIYHDRISEEQCTVS